MNTYAAIALGAVGLAVLCAIAFAFRRVVNDRAPLPFFRMLARRGLDPKELEGAVGARQLALAVRRCALCGGKDDCRAAFEAGHPEAVEADCPNTEFFEAAKRR
jgi:hypothetical protein